MTVQETKRPVLFLEIVNTESLILSDELAATRILKDYLRAASGIAAGHEGRFEAGSGNRHLVFFADLGGAVSCALAIGQEFDLRNAALPDQRRVHWRMGLAWGEVREESGRWAGDGVSGAEQAGGLARTDELCVTQAVADHVRQAREAEAGFEIEAAGGTGWSRGRFFHLRATAGPERRKRPILPRGLWTTLLIVLGAVVILAAWWKFRP